MAKRLENIGTNFKDIETDEVILRGQLHNVGNFDGTGLTEEQISRKADELSGPGKRSVFYRAIRGERGAVSYIVYKSIK